MGGAEHEINECAHIQVAKHNETVKQNRAFLNRLIDVTSWLGQQELSLRLEDMMSIVNHPTRGIPGSSQKHLLNMTLSCPHNSIPQLCFLV